MTWLFWAIILLIAVWLIWIYNDLVALRHQIENAWKQIELERLKAMALTPAEQRSFTKLSKELGSQE